VIETRPASPSGYRWVAPVAAAWIVCLGLLLAWTLWTPIPVLRLQLRVLQFWSLETCVALGVVVSVVVLKDASKLIEKRHLPGVVVPLVVGLVLTVGVAARTNRIFYDEQIYQNVGQNLADLRRAQLCNDGALVDGRLRCSIAEYNKQPYAYPHILSLVYRAVGVGTAPAFVINAVAMGLSICLVYVLVILVFGDPVAAFFAALLFALTPQQLIWSASAAVEPSASAACLAALLAAVCFVRLGSFVSLLGAAVAAAYAVQFRPESMLIVPVVALFIWQRAPQEFSRPRIWWAGLIFLVLASVHLAHTAAVRNEGWGTTQARMSLDYVVANLRANGRFYIADARFPALYSLLALVGAMAWRRERGRLTLIGFFVLFFGVALVFYAGSYNYGADVRYSLATYPALAMLGGLGAARTSRSLDRFGLDRLSVPSLALVLALQFLWYLPPVRSTDDGAWAARADVRFAESLVRDLPANAYVLTQNPGMFQVWGVNAGQTSLIATSPSRLQDLARQYAGGVYFHWNFWCNVDDPVQRGYCTQVLAASRGRVVREERVRDQRFALYSLNPSPSRR
jgi:Dolichyl-phosphate-mannose-protein mannosyltransferase